MRRRRDVLGKDKWDLVKSWMRRCDVKGTIFEILPNHARGPLIKLRDFKFEYATQFCWVVIFFALKTYSIKFLVEVD
jgi:hypothetical protein